MKVRIVTSHFNRPDFVELQYLSMKKYVKDKDVELIVVNDAFDYAHIRNWNNKNVKKEIEDMCKKYGILCIPFPQNLHGGNRYRLYPSRLFEFWKTTHYNNSNTRCSDVCQFGYNLFGKNFDGIYVCMDGDMFFERDVNFNEVVKDYDMLGVPQTRGVKYWWNGIVVFNMQTLKNKHLISFDCGLINKQPTDCGGQLYWYKYLTPEAKIKDVPKSFCGLWDYGCGSNWWHENYTRNGFVKKEAALKIFLKTHNFKINVLTDRLKDRDSKKKKRR